MFDSSAPVPEFLSSLISPTNDPNNIVSLVFNEAVVGDFEAGLALTNCSIDSIAQSDSSFTFEIIPEQTGIVSVATLEGTFHDNVGNGNLQNDTLTYIMIIHHR